nr:hypothetical protein [Tanacetum cinerariifolium]
IDFMGPFPSSRGNKYILVAVDYLSKWVEAEALPTNDARVVCKFLKYLFARFGAPRAIISERGTHFCNDQFKKVMRKYGVTHRLSTAYHPQTSGQVEVKEILKKEQNRIKTEQKREADESKNTDGENDLEAYYTNAEPFGKALPRKEKGPGSFTLSCFINNMCFNKALADLGASVSVMSYTTYTTLGLGDLIPTKLIVELVDRIVKQPKGIAENVLVGIDKVTFPVDFIILDTPEDLKTPLILGRPFFSTAHAIINVFKEMITLSVGNDKIFFESNKPTSNVIKRVFMDELMKEKGLHTAYHRVWDTAYRNLHSCVFNCLLVLLAWKNELKARGTLLMALLDKHKLKFNIHKDAKSLMEAIEKRFGGNKETKKDLEAYQPTGNSWNKIDLEDQSLDDLFNSLKIYEAEVKSSSSTSPTTQNIAFVSSQNTDSTNESVSAVNSVFAANTKVSVFALPNVDTLSDAMAMLTMRVRRFLQRTRRNLGANGTTSIGFDMSKVECYNCHKREHFARECRSPKDTRNKETQRRNVPLETSTSNALVSQCDGVGSYNWSFQADEEPTNYALMGGCSKKSFLSRPLGGLESVEARIVVYQQNENVFEEDIKLLKLDVMLRDNALVDLRKKFKKAEQERDELKLKLENFQTSSKNLSQLLASQMTDKTSLGYDNHVFHSTVFDSDELISSESDVSMPTSPVYDRYKSGDGYHAVPSPYTGTFMPPKPDLVFHDAPTFNATVSTVLNVEPSPTKPNKDTSQSSRTSAPIIEDWVSDSGDESKVEHPIPAVNLKKDIPKSRGHRHSWNRKACFVCKSLTHSIKDCDYYETKMVQKPITNYAMRENHQHYARMTHPHPHRHVVPTTVLTRSRLVPLTAARPVTTTVSHIKVQHQKPTKHGVTKAHSPSRRPINLRPSPTHSNFHQQVTTVKTKQIQVSYGLGPQKTLTFLFDVQGNPQHALKDKGVIDSGCSWHMTGNISYLSDFEEINGGYVAFCKNPKGGKITGKDKIRTGKLDFDYVYFVKELKFNLISVSKMCDKKNCVLFTYTECIVLSSNFKLPDDNHVLLRVPRENNMYNVDLKNIVPSGDLTCLFAKATFDESNLSHIRLCHINFKTMNKLVNGNLVRGLPSKVFENNHTCVACKKGKQHRASYFNQLCGMKGIKREFSVARNPQQNGFTERKNMTLIEAVRTMLANSLLPIPFLVEAVNTACYVQNRVLVSKPHNKTPYELLLGRTPSVGFMRPFGCPVTILNTIDPLGNQPNSITGIQEPFDVDKAKERNVQQYVLFFLWSSGSKDTQNTDANTTFEVKEPESKVHVSPSSSAKTKKHDDKTKREDKGKSPVKLSIGARNLSEVFEDFSDNSINGFNAASTLVSTVGQNSTNNTNTFSVAGPSNTAVSLTLRKSSYVDPSQYLDGLDMPALEDITYSDDDEEDVGAEAEFSNLETNITVSHIPTTRVHKDHPVTQIIGDLSSAPQTMSMTRMVKEQGGLTQINNDDFHTCMFACFLSLEEPKRVFRNKKDERSIVVRNKARLVAQGHTQEEGIDYKEVFSPVARIEVIRLFLAYASFMGFMVYQMNVKCAFLYGTIEEDVYVFQPPGFKDHGYPDKVYNVVKALYGLHQAPRAWFETLANYFLENGFQRGKIDQTLFIKKKKGDILLVQVCVDDIIFGSTNKDLCKAFEKLMKDKFQMSSMDGKSASTPIDTKKPFLKDPDGDDMDVNTYRLMICLLMYLTSSRPDIMFAVCACVCFQVTPKASHLHAVKRIFRVGKGVSRVDTLLFEGILVPQQVNVDVVADAAKPTPPSPTTTPPPLQQELIPLTSQDKIAQAREITKLKQRARRLKKKSKLKVSRLTRLRKVRTAQRVKSLAGIVMDDQEDASKQGRIAKIDVDEDVTLKEVAAKVPKDADADPAELTEVIQVVTTAKLMTEVVTATATTAATTIIAALMPAASAARRRKGVVIRDPEEIATLSVVVHSEPKSKDKGKGILVEEHKPLKKQAQIEQDEAYAKELGAELNANINWNEVIEQVKRKEKQDNTVMRYQALKRKPQTEAHARKNMMVYLRNMAGFKMDFFKGMTYDNIRPIFEKHFNSIVAFLEKGEEELEEEASKQSKGKNENSEEETAKKHKLDEEVEEIKTHLQIVPNDEDDVYTEATPLALKVPVVDYQIHTEHNKPYYKIIRAHGTHQLFLSFISLLRNFKREDLEMLWKILNVKAHIWKSQRGGYGLAKVKSWKLLESCGVHIITFITTQMILLVERRYPLTRFTLDQMLNNVRLEVEEESEVSLVLLRFVRRQQQEGYRPE